MGIGATLRLTVKNMILKLVSTPKSILYELILAELGQMFGMDNILDSSSAYPINTYSATLRK